MQNEKRNVITIERFKEPQESDVFVPCPIVWSGDCGCVTPLPLITDCRRAWKKMHQWCCDWHLTFPLPHLSCGGNNNVMSEWHIHIKPYLKTHIFIAQEKMHWIRIQFCPTDVHSSEKSHFISPIAHDSQFGSFHRWSIFHILFTHKLCTLSIYRECYIYALIYISHIFDNLYHISIYSYILSNSSGSLLSSF